MSADDAQITARQCAGVDASAAADILLHHALSLSGARAGCLFAFDPRGPGGEVVASALEGVAKAAAADLIQAWKNMSPRARAAGLEAGFEAAPTSFYAPLLDGAFVTGFVVLGKPARRGSAGLQEVIGQLASCVPFLYRAVLRERFARIGAPVDIVGESRPFLEAERQIRRISTSDCALLITGERGSGKELAGWATHCWSLRWKGPFVPVLTSTLPRSMAAAELFGHERNSFTDAARSRLGKFGAAEGGSVFLDEIGDLEPSIQSALLRVVEYQELARIGTDRPPKADVRIIAATNRDLGRMIPEGRFRADLHDRLRVFEIQMPPLRKRLDDIPVLADYFFRHHCRELQRLLQLTQVDVCRTCGKLPSPQCASPGFIKALQAYHWPGNVRELRNVLVRVMAAHPSQLLDACHLEVFAEAQAASKSEAADQSLETAVRRHIRAVLRQSRGNQSEAARRLGIPLSTLRSKMKKLSIEPSQP